MPNPITILSAVPALTKWFSVIDLANAFFSMQQVTSSGENVSWLFIAGNSELETAGAVERESKTAGLGQSSTSGEQVRVP